jgi:hypothetical protein
MYIVVYCSQENFEIDTKRTKELYNIATKCDTIEYVSIYPHFIQYGYPLWLLEGSNNDKLIEVTKDSLNCDYIQIECMDDQDNLKRLFELVSAKSLKCLFIIFGATFKFNEILTIIENVSNTLLMYN